MSEQNLRRNRFYDDAAALSHDGEKIAPLVAESIEDIPWAEVVDERETVIEMEDVWFLKDEPPEPFPLPPIPAVVFVLFLIAFFL